MSSRQDSNARIAALLSGLPLFAGFEEALLSELAGSGQLIELPPRRRLFGSGEPIRLAHVLLAGSVKRSTLLSNAVEKVLELVRPGQLLALSEVFSARTYTSSAHTVQPSLVVALPVGRLMEIASHHPGLSLRLLETMAERHFAAEFEVVSHHALPGAQRVLDYLLHLAGDRRGIAGETTVQLDASKKLIAARLDMTPETFSRTLRQLSSDGVIVVSGRVIHIQNATLADGKPAAAGKPPGAPLRYPRLERKAEERRVSPAALVNLCGRHRMLSQRLATVWCIVARKLPAGAARGALRKFHGQFERNLAQVGALVQSMSPELQPEIDALARIWGDCSELFFNQPPAGADPRAAFDLSEQVLRAADELTAASARVAGTPEAHCVNIAGRNRMLTARLTKLFLFCDWDVRTAEAKKLMAASRREFDTNIAKLSDFAADSPEIAAQLAIDTEQWRALTSIIDAPSHFEMPHGHAREVLAAGEELLRHMDTTVKLYERLADKRSSARHLRAGHGTAHSTRSQ
ncbi:MAG: type IV pili methyl-accepting chemotaxis transducer N-terminal domain-containing protein [Rhodocyclaceae bacterium]|nr:type IV pili methyl-accepting chemotaxis transducer N-terminal domain-containing protein [Rhodocyclaceae bacterium]